MNRYTPKTGVSVDLKFLVPEGDTLAEYIRNVMKTDCFEGDENDLISRYHNCVKDSGVDYDYVVRLTADCPLLPSYLISKCINTAIKNEYDFLDTANPKYRSFFDGADVEVLSGKALGWLEENSKEREHVCNALRENGPASFKYGHIFSYLDLSRFKLSVDTQKDFDLVQNQYRSLEDKKRKWEENYGKQTAHMF